MTTVKHNKENAQLVIIIQLFYIIIYLMFKETRLYITTKVIQNNDNYGGYQSSRSTTFANTEEINGSLS